MDEEIMECLGDKGFRCYNSLREFYDEPDRIQILEYIIRYAAEELNFLGVDDDKKFSEIARLRGYLIVKELYDANIERLNSGECSSVPLRFPSDEEIRAAIRKNYAGLEKKIIGEK